MSTSGACKYCYSPASDARLCCLRVLLTDAARSVQRRRHGRVCWCGVAVCRRLDYERQSLYQLTVTAHNLAAHLPLSSSVNVTISVIDVDDCLPTFQRPLYRAHVSADCPVGHQVVSTSLSLPRPCLRRLSRRTPGSIHLSLSLSTAPTSPPTVPSDTR